MKPVPHGSVANLVEPERALFRLRQTMERVGADMSPEKFVEIVTQAYREARRATAGGNVDPPFERDASHGAFLDGLRQVRDRLSSPGSVLVLGCGPTYVGADAAYAAGLVRQTIPQDRIRELRVHNLSRSDLHDLSASGGWGRFDLVVSHSLLHFVAELSLVLRLVVQLVSAAGYYLMAHEPNARFWRREELVAARILMTSARARRKRWAKYLAPSVYADKLKRMLYHSRFGSFEERVNQVLARSYGLRGGLSWREIAQLTDPHRPCEAPGEFRIGLHGLDPDSMTEAGFETMGLLWERSYDHLGSANYSGLTRQWRRLAQALSARYPLEGAAWTSLWKKTL